MSTNDFIGIAKQSAEKTANETWTYYPPVTAESMTIERELVEIDETSGYRTPNAISYGSKHFAGDLEGGIRSDSYPLLLASGMGAPTSAAWSGSVASYKHTFLPHASSTLTPITLLTVNKDMTPIIEEVYYGVYSDTIEISCAVDEYLMFNHGLVAIGAKIPASANATSTPDTSKMFVASQIGLYAKAGTSAPTTTSCASVDALAVSDFTLSYSNNLSTDAKVLCSTELQSVPVGNMECDFSFTLKDGAKFKTFYDYVKADTVQDMRVIVRAVGDNIAGETSKPYYMEIELFRFQVTEAPVDIDAGNPLTEVQVSGKAARFETAGADLNKVLRIEMSNKVASY